MTELVHHQQLQRGLDAITRVSVLLNAKRVELQRADEALKASLELKKAVDISRRDYERGQKARQDALEGLNLAIRQAEARKDAVMAAIAQLELEKAREITGIAAAQNSVLAMKTVKEREKGEMSLYDRLKAEKLAEYHTVQADLDAIRRDRHAEDVRLTAVKAEASEKETDMERRARELDDKESGLVVRAVYLDKIERRLKKYAETLNIPL